MTTSFLASRPWIARLLRWLPLLLLAVAAPPRRAGAATVDLTLLKRIAGTSGQLGPFAMPTGQVFTYELQYTWGSAVPQKKLEIVDLLPPGVELAPPPPGPGIPQTNPASSWSSATVSGRTQITFSIDTSGSPNGGTGTVTIPVRLVPGAHCTSSEPLCNRDATIAVKSDPTTKTPVSPPSKDFPDPCVVPQARDRWTTSLVHHHGCACDQKVLFEVAITSPAGGDVGGLDMIDPKVTLSVPAPANGATFSGVVTVSNFPATTTAAWGSSTVPAGQITGAGTAQLTVDLTGVTLGVRDAWTYHLYVEVVFPCAAYAGGTGTVEASLAYKTPCGVAAPVVLGPASVAICPPQTKATVSKSLEFSADPQIPASVVAPCLCPGCCAWYRVYYGNSGTVPITNPSFEDFLPAGLDVSEVRTEVPSWATGVGVTVEETPGTTVPGWGPRTYAGSGWHVDPVSATSGSIVSRVRWAYTGVMPTGDSVVVWLRVCNRGSSQAPVPDNVVKGDHAADFVLPTPIGPCGPRLYVRKEYLGRHCGDLGWQGAVPAGTTVRFCLAVANVGPVTASNVQLVDHLPPGVTYVPGSETYAYHAVSHLPAAAHTPAFCADFGPASSVAGTVGALAPGVPSGSSPQTVTWTVPTLPGRCDGVLEGLDIQFDVVIDASVAPGTYANRFDAVLDGVTTTSNDAEFVVGGVPQWRIEKWVRAVGTTSWTKSVHVAAGAQVEFLLQLRNASNVAVMSPCLVDVMPHPTDDLVLPTPLGGSSYLSRGSTFDLPVTAGSVVTAQHHAGDASTGTSTVLAPPAATTTWFQPVASSRNPDRNGTCLGGCGPTIPNPVGAAAGTWTATGSAPAGAFALQVSAPGLTLAPGESFVAVVRATVPSGATGVACNNVAASAVTGGTCVRAQTLDVVCVHVDPPPRCLEVKTETLVCDGPGSFTWTMTVTNLSGQAVNQVQFPASGNVLVAPALVPVGPLQPGDHATVTVTLSGPGAVAGATVCVPMALAFGNPAVVADRLCMKDVCVTLPACTGADCPGTLVVHKFDDDEGDKDPTGDAGLASVVFTVKQGSTTVATGATGASGIATFVVPAGTYTVVETVPSGWTSTTGASQTVVVPAGGVKVVEFGDRREGPTGFNLSVVKTMSPNPLTPGGTAVATIILTNHGPGACPGPISVTDAWSPAGALTLTSSTSTPTSGWTLSGSTWTRNGPLPANSSVKFTYTFTVTSKPVDSVRNCARVKTAEKDLVPEDDESCVEVPVVRDATSNLAVTKRMEPNPLTAGGAGVATITLVNHGPAACPGPITVSDVVAPAGALGLGAVTPPPGWTYAAGVFTWSASNPPLPLGTTVFTVPFQVSSTAPRVVTNCAVVRSETKDPKPADNRACVELPVRPSEAPFDLVVRKDMPPGPYAVGQKVTATITVVNAGPGPCPGPVVLRDVWTPAGTLALASIVPQQTGWTVDVPNATATLAGPLGAQVPQTFLCTFVVTAGAPGGIVTNCAFVQSMRGDTNPGNNRACVERPVVGLPGTPTDGPVAPGTDAAPGRLCVRAFEDRNGNGRPDRGEAPLPGVPVVLRGNKPVRGVDHELPSRQTAPDGRLQWQLRTDRDGRACVEGAGPFEAEVELADPTRALTVRTPIARTVRPGESVEVLLPVRAAAAGPEVAPSSAPKPRMGLIETPSTRSAGTMMRAVLVGADGRPYDLLAMGSVRSVEFAWTTGRDGSRAVTARVVMGAPELPSGAPSVPGPLASIEIVLKTETGAVVTYRYQAGATDSPRATPPIRSLRLGG